MVGGALATATALTVGMAAPSANAAATGPDYTQIITDSSNSLNNVLFIVGNLGGAGAAIWNPLATAVPGGLLPTFTAGTTQEDLTSITGLLAALSKISVPDLSGVPGLPPNATTLLTAGLLPGLGPALVIVGPVLGETFGVLGTVGTVLAGLNAINGVLQALNLPLITGIPTLGDLIPGLTVTQTTFESAYDWPLLGLGPLLGLSGETTISNTFAQLPSLTVSDLVGGITDGLVVPALPPVLQGAVNGLLAQLDAIDVVETPSVTAWIPLGQGNYGLPLGGSIGWLATMPTLAVGPVSVGPVVLSDTDTVIAIPLVAAGAVLPLGLASLGTVATPGVVFPTATGLSTLGGTSLTSLAVPLAGLSLTNLNLLSATYVGTNGVNYNSGTSLLTLATPLGALPIVYSLGSYNVGTTGLGFTLPSLFTIGLLPSFQIGTAPTQQSPDGLIPASLLNLGLAVPTQTTDLVTLLGLPNPIDPVEAVLNPVFNTLVVPVGALVTNGLNGVVGPLANGFASLTEQLTALLAQLTGAGAQALTSTTAATTLATPAEQEPAPANSSALQAITPTTTGPSTPIQAPAALSEPADPAATTGPRLNVVTQLGNPARDLIEDGTDTARTTGSNARTQLTTTVKTLTAKVTDTVGDITAGTRDRLSGDSANSSATSTSTATP